MVGSNTPTGRWKAFLCLIMTQSESRYLKFPVFSFRAFQARWIPRKIFSSVESGTTPHFTFDVGVIYSGEGAEVWSLCPFVC
jgi:hypothetical protein